jgi:hypothetical protein
MGEFEEAQADRVAADRLVVADKTFGMQRAQHFGRRADRADPFARIALAGIIGSRSPRDRAGPLGFKALCLEGACCRTR